MEASYGRAEERIKTTKEEPEAGGAFFIKLAINSR
jgi:hypothetical protein